MPPPKAEKAERIAQAKEAQKVEAREGPARRRSVRKQAQEANKAQATREAVTLVVPLPVADVGFIPPGTQPTNQQLRQMAKATRKQLRDDATEAGKAAGRAVRDVLLDRRANTAQTDPNRRLRNAQKTIDEARKLRSANAKG
jgi:hypothetical protein